MKSRTPSLVDIDFIDKSKIFIELHSPAWRSPMKMSLEQLTLSQNNETPLLAVNYVDKQIDLSEKIDNQTLIIDPDTLKIKVNTNILSTPSVFSERFIDQHINYKRPPINAKKVTGMHLMTDNNYLYVWIENRWKRIPLNEY